MMSDDRHTDQYFRDRLEHYGQEPPAQVWGAVQERLAAAARRRRMIVMRRTGIAAAVMLAFITGWWLSRSVQDLPLAETPLPMSGYRTTIPPTEEPPDRALVHPHALQPDTATGSFSKIRQEAINADGQSSGQEAFAPDEVVREYGARPSLLDPRIALVEARFSDKPLAEMPLATDNEKSAGLTGADLIMMEENSRLLAFAGEERQSSWLVGAQLAPGMTVSQASYQESYARNMSYAAANNDFSLAGGLSVEYRHGKRWSLQSGLYYSKLAQSSESRTSHYMYSDVYTGENLGYFNAPVKLSGRSREMNAVAGVIDFDQVPAGLVIDASFEADYRTEAVMAASAEFTQDFEYLEIPLYVRYRLVDLPVSVQLVGGISSNILVGNNAYLQDDAGRRRVGETKDMAVLNYSGTLGLGFSWKLSDALQLQVEPRLKYFFSSLNKNSAVNFQPYSLGVFTGLSYEF